MSRNALDSPWQLTQLVLPHARRLLLSGPPGTGKSYAAARIGLRPGQPVLTVTLTDEMPAAELRGHFVPFENRFVWKDGPAIHAWRKGARLVLNEIDHAGTDTLSFLLAILDDPDVAAITLPNNETVRPREGFSVVATMNGSPDQDLPAALRDRFPITIEINEVHPSALQKLSPDLRAAAAGTVLHEDESRSFSYRAWEEFDYLRKLVGDEPAARAAFGRRAKDTLASIRLAGR